MKSFTASLLAIVAVAAVVGMVTVGMQQAYAPRDCGACVEFKRLTHGFEKAVLAGIQDPEN